MADTALLMHILISKLHKYTTFITNLEQNTTLEKTPISNQIDDSGHDVCGEHIYKVSFKSDIWRFVYNSDK